MEFGFYRFRVAYSVVFAVIGGDMMTANVDYELAVMLF